MRKLEKHGSVSFSIGLGEDWSFGSMECIGKISGTGKYAIHYL